MAERDDFRKLSSFELLPMYISLGVPEPAFKPSGFATRTKLFDTALNGDQQFRPDSVWLFKGSEYFTYNIAKGSFDDAGLPIAHNWCGDTWPMMFSSGIDVAAWCGEIDPTLWFLFKGDQYIRINSNTAPHWTVTRGPKPIKDDWFQPQADWLQNGAVALHGLSPKFHGKLHIFKGNEYLLHDFTNGHIAAGPGPIKEFWHLPEPFTSKIDLAFYGTGRDNEQSIYFFSGNQVALYDTKIKETIKVAPIEQFFPAFAQFMTRPQIFLVETYRLETYIGRPQLGRLIETRNVPPGTETKTLMVTESIDSRADTLHNSLLNSQDKTVVTNFNNQMSQKLEDEQSSEQYRYQMKAKAGVEARLMGIVSGEINASLATQGGSDTLRNKFASSTFASIESQVNESTRQVNLRTYDSQAAIENKERVLKQEELVVKNPTDKLRVIEFYQQLQPYVTLLVLTDVRVAYSDGTEAPRIVPLSGLPELLNSKLTNEEEKAKLIQFVTNELGSIKDQDGQARAIVKGGQPGSPAALELVPNPNPVYSIQHANGDVQKIVAEGLMIKAAKQWLTPTMTLIAVDVKDS